MHYCQQSNANEFGSLHYNYLFNMPYLLKTITCLPAIPFSALSFSPHFEDHPIFSCSATPFQKQVGTNLGVQWSETSTLTTSVDIHPAFPLKKGSETFLSKTEETHSFFTVWSQKMLVLPQQCEKQQWLEHTCRELPRVRLPEEGRTMKLQVYLEWMQGLIALPSFQV